MVSRALIKNVDHGNSMHDLSLRHVLAGQLRLRRVLRNLVFHDVGAWFQSQQSLLALYLG